MRSIPKETDLAYLAGVIDGEGCFDVHHDIRNSSLYPRLRVEMTHCQTVDWIQGLFPGILIKPISRPNRNHSTTYRWCIQGPKAIEVTKLILPYLKAKRLEAELFMTFPYPDQKPGNKRCLPIEVVERRMVIRFGLRECKTKGKGRIKGGSENGE